ncbi:MAG: hypothetical protein EX271_01440 [Acidimicrobiales bacterium]|nr:hypothetical protein [Hyphomonadaceae bacterium]RZV44559.1 MAG: hypothetical protein EX271_01440 [Acidimicrobiales bacterium]
MAKTAQTQIKKTTDAVRKGFRAYVGLYGAAYERIVPVVKTAGKNYDELAAKGEKLETAAQDFAKDFRSNAQKTVEGTVGKVRSVLPRAANDRVEELEAEITRLNKKLSTKAKKATKKPVKRAAKATKNVAEKVEAKAEKVEAKAATAA